MKIPRTHRSPFGRGQRQRGVVLLFSLIALVIMLIAAVALVRSFNSSLFTAGNVAFKRDLQNQSERAVEKAFAAFQATGSLALPATRAASQPGSNYSAQMLPVNAQGIPLALRNDTTFGAVGVTTNDITPLNEPSLDKQGVQIRYVIDRLCLSGGDESSLGAGDCVLAENPVGPGVGLKNQISAQTAGLGSGLRAAGSKGLVYRLSVKVTGPRSTQSFFQSTFTVPSS